MNLKQQQGLQGFDPAFVAVSDFQSGEDVVIDTPTENCIELSTPTGLTSRKIYCWLWAGNTGANYLVRGEIVFYKNNSQVGRLPMSLGGGTLRQTITAVCLSGGLSVQDCLGIYLANPTGTQPASAVLQPLYLTGEFDRVVFAVREMVNVTTARAFLACISSR
jgi:hypothetical protein